MKTSGILAMFISGIFFFLKVQSFWSLMNVLYRSVVKIKHLLMVRWVIGSIPHNTDWTFQVPASAPQLV